MSEAAPGEARTNASGDWLEELPCRVGQIIIEQNATTGFRLCHYEDCGREISTTHTDANTAAEIARYDDAGAYRPLKTAPNLRHGWVLLLFERAAVRLAIDLFYPARMAAWSAASRGVLRTTPFRETLSRQTGMYRIATKISDDQANDLIANFCRSDGGCLRTIVWKRDANGTLPSTSLPARKFDAARDQIDDGRRGVPLLCQEACNLLVAAAREVVKAER